MTNLHTAGTEAAGSTGIMLQHSKMLAWEHPTKQRMKEGQILEAERFKPSCSSSAGRELGGPQLSSWAGRGHISRDLQKPC